MRNNGSILVSAGPMKGKAFAFDEHDTSLFGRMEECLCYLPDEGQRPRWYRAWRKTKEST